MPQHYMEEYECGHVGGQCRCPGPKTVHRLEGPCPSCFAADHEEAKVREERPDFISLHGSALRRIADDIRDGFPRAVRQKQAYKYMADWVRAGIGDSNVVHEVQLVLEDDGLLSRDYASAEDLDAILG